MTNFWNNLVGFLGVLPRMAIEELRGFRNSFMWLVGFLYAICIFQLIVNNYTLSAIFGLILSILSTFALFNIRRITSITLTGEAAEIFRITPKNNNDQGSAAVVINPLSTMFWNVSLQIYFFVIIAFLLVPVLPLKNNPMFVVLFPTIAVAVAIAFKGTALRATNWIASVFVLCLLLVHSVMLFPQISVQTRIGSAISSVIIPTSTAKSVAKVDKIIAMQKEDAINTDIEKIQAWQKANPGKPLPEQYRIFLSNIKNGKMIPLSDMTKRDEVCFLSIEGSTHKEYELDKGDYEMSKAMLVMVDGNSQKTERFSVSEKQTVLIGHEGSGVFEGQLYKINSY